MAGLTSTTRVVNMGTMQTNIDHEPMLTKRRQREPRTATRFTLNPNWNRRGDNTKYRSQK